MNSIDGIFLLDKPSGMTSHDAVDFVRREFGYKKVGHAGTLDPIATGLLILLLGRYTKMANQFLNLDKEYDVVLKLGVSTDTGDRAGFIIKKSDLNTYHLTKSYIEKILKHFKGRIKQIPPMYSAKKIDGKKLYELARRGIVVKRDYKEVEIYYITAKRITLPYLELNMRCSKGTYIRQVAHDIGEKLKCGAHVYNLRRVAIGPFRIENAIHLEGIKINRELFYENILQP